MLPKVPNSQQVFREYAEVYSEMFKKDLPAEDYFQLKRDHENLLNAFTSLLAMVSDGEFSPLNGTGSPEGVVTSNYSQLYVDTAVPTLYFNSVIGVNTGWSAL